MAGLEWHGDEAKDMIRQRAAQGVTAACIAVSSQAKRLLSHAGTGKIKGQRNLPVTHSAPGESPYKQTGRLRASVTYETDPATLTGRVGTNVAYGRYLELGTKRGIAPRPWLRRALNEMRARIDGIMARANTEIDTNQ